MICEKTKVPNTPRSTAIAKIVGLHELFLLCFLAFVRSKKNYQRKSSTSKHAVVNSNNSKVEMESRIVKSRWNQESSGYLKLVSTLQTHEIINHKKTVVSSVFIDIIAWQIFAPRKKISSKNKYLFKYFYFFRFISKQFADFASLKIQMQITFAKSFNVLNNAA